MLDKYSQDAHDDYYDKESDGEVKPESFIFVNAQLIFVREGVVNSQRRIHFSANNCTLHIELVKYLKLSSSTVLRNAEPHLQLVKAIISAGDGDEGVC